MAELKTPDMCFFISVGGPLVITPFPSIWRLSARHALRCIGALSADCWTRRWEQHLSPNGLSCWLIRWPEQTIREEPGLHTHTHTHTHTQAQKGLKGFKRLTWSSVRNSSSWTHVYLLASPCHVHLSPHFLCFFVRLSSKISPVRKVDVKDSPLAELVGLMIARVNKQLCFLYLIASVRRLSQRMWGGIHSSHLNKWLAGTDLSDD